MSATISDLVSHETACPGMDQQPSSDPTVRDCRSNVVARGLDGASVLSFSWQSMRSARGRFPFFPLFFSSSPPGPAGRKRSLSRKFATRSDERQWQHMQQNCREDCVFDNGPYAKSRLRAEGIGSQRPWDISQGQFCRNWALNGFEPTACLLDANPPRPAIGFIWHDPLVHAFELYRRTPKKMTARELLPFGPRSKLTEAKMGPPRGLNRWSSSHVRGATLD